MTCALLRRLVVLNAQSLMDDTIIHEYELNCNAKVRGDHLGLELLVGDGVKEGAGFRRPAAANASEIDKAFMKRNSFIDKTLLKRHYNTRI